MRINRQRSWFHIKNIEFLEIREYAGIADHRVLRYAEIRDLMIIKTLKEQIEQMPAQGDMMKSFSDDTRQTDLLFHGKEGIDKIEIYDKRFKTPSTGFNQRSEYELNLYMRIESLLKNSQ